MPLSFAAETEVSPERSRAEIERMLTKAGAAVFGIMVKPEVTAIAFEACGRRYRLAVQTPDHRHPYVQKTPSGQPRPQPQWEMARKRLIRIRWRTLALGVKARLAECEIGPSSLQEAFLPFLLLPSGDTVAEETEAPIALAYQGRSIPLLPGA